MPSATRRAGQQTAPLPSWLDQVAAAEAVCAVFLREGISETSYHRLCCWYLRDAWFALLGHRCPDRFLIRLRHRWYWLRRCRLPHRHDMHDRWRRGGRNGLHILWRKKLRWLGSEAFRPGFGGHAPRCWTRLILDRPDLSRRTCTTSTTLLLPAPGPLRRGALKMWRFSLLRAWEPCPFRVGKTRSASDMSFHDGGCSRWSPPAREVGTGGLYPKPRLPD